MGTSPQVEKASLTSFPATPIADGVELLAAALGPGANAAPDDPRCKLAQSTNQSGINQIKRQRPARTAADDEVFKGWMARLEML